MFVVCEGVMMGTNDYDNADYVGMQNFVGVSRLSSKTIEKGIQI